MTFEKPADNPNCQADGVRCDLCQEIGQRTASAVLSDLRKELRTEEINYRVEQSAMKAQIEGSGSEVTALNCFSRQDRAERIGANVAARLARDRNYDG